MRALLALLGFAAAALCAGPPPENQKITSTLIVQVDGFKTFKGFLRLALFNRTDGFPAKAEKAFRHISIPVKTQTETVRLENIPCGAYAVSVHHDINGNRRLEKSILGIPQEPIALSNNPAIRFGPPKFSDAQFQLRPDEMIIAIHLPQSVARKSKERP